MSSLQVHVQAAFTKFLSVIGTIRSLDITVLLLKYGIIMEVLGRHFHI